MKCVIRYFDVSLGQAGEYVFEDIKSVEDLKMPNNGIENPWNAKIVSFIHNNKSFSVKTDHFISMTID